MLFKYISCSYLSCLFQYLLKYLRYSNTSHVLIYQSVFLLFMQSVAFKYISCSYLSLTRQYEEQKTSIQIHLMFLFISMNVSDIRYGNHDSNTSHVLIYPSNTTNQNLFIKFKYISCSYLSLSG